ncbi:thiamine pyrophosphate-dependent dehydrogenase E1 component subunit alpha [Spongiactinospora sp. TRM90649]|uniref:thiamine pyrophosphate-dependent dehydrogenase E1 component subunit alpha n=1 Tax=Spongiactinospora sp. TRM90649 TaxID=3031114 RepID=UPI0023F7DAA2|nr:thiamine pyrophosphate-dependent dehydrogenase E1 component subunit alpha [Spongiactinospora sp. TRM90649]MDF5754044.1 thiamine pyrophosphate-dependent dehydrogenase E1 component subunit alpha [Spongiactinospora sp. TRM90649]
MTDLLDRPPGGMPYPLGEDGDLSLMLLIRAFERKLLDLFAAGMLNGTTHTCLGQEHVPVALAPLMEPRDHVFSNHRGHGHYLARYRDAHGLLAEIMGREGAICGGVGGSQHIHRDRYLSTGVQGESLPVAAGVALHLSRTDPGAVAWAYIGDGTFGEGALYEAFNIAALWRLPLVVVVENNGIAQSTPTGAHMAGTVAGRAAAFGIRHHFTGSTDVTEIRDGFAAAVEGVRAGRGPLVLEFRTHRIGPHSKGDDTRDEQALREALAGDWYHRYAADDPGTLHRLEAEQRDYVAAVAAEVAARPPSSGRAACA